MPTMAERRLVGRYMAHKTVGTVNRAIMPAPSKSFSTPALSHPNRSAGARPFKRRLGESSRMEMRHRMLAILLAAFLTGCKVEAGTHATSYAPDPMPTDGFSGSKAGAERVIAGIKFCWCPPGRFTMGSPPNEPE